MANYKRMYLTLVSEICSMLEHLKATLEKAEEIYIETDDESEAETTDIVILN